MRVAVLIGLSTLALASSPPSRADEAAVGRVLDALHQRASAADFDGYFELYHERAVFLGTARDEYWPLERFKAYTRSRFDTGRGWTYVPTERFVHVAGDTAWFEERLQHAVYGETRGTGVLLRTAAGWRVVQYNLTLPIPNALFRDMAERIADYHAGEAPPHARPDRAP